MSAQVFGTWNNDGIYLFINVMDDVISSVNDQANYFHDDSIELYFDPNMKRNGNFDTVNDIKINLHIKEDGSFFYVSLYV